MPVNGISKETFSAANGEVWKGMVYDILSHINEKLDRKYNSLPCQKTFKSAWAWLLAGIFALGIGAALFGPKLLSAVAGG